MLFLLTKPPWEISLRCPDPVAAPPQELAVSLTEAMQFFAEQPVTETLETVQGKEKTPEERHLRLLSLLLCVCVCLSAF